MHSTVDLRRNTQLFFPFQKNIIAIKSKFSFTWFSFWNQSSADNNFINSLSHRQPRFKTTCYCHFRWKMLWFLAKDPQFRGYWICHCRHCDSNMCHTENVSLVESWKSLDKKHKLLKRHKDCCSTERNLYKCVCVCLQTEWRTRISQAGVNSWLPPPNSIHLQEEERNGQYGREYSWRLVCRHFEQCESRELNASTVFFGIKNTFPSP